MLVGTHPINCVVTYSQEIEDERGSGDHETENGSIPLAYVPERSMYDMSKQILEARSVSRLR
jgi:hypothetical protein